MRDAESLSDKEYDLLVVGGGITGACAALDAAQRGLSVALVEKWDFSAATSAQSLKMLHGGIRYLQHLDLVRLRESCKERMAFLRNAPHLTRPLPIVVPTYGLGMQGKFVFRMALWINHLLTFDRNRAISDKNQQIPVGRILSRREMLHEFPFVDSKGLTGGACFYDGQMLNPPRIVWAIIQSAMSAGANACNYCDVQEITSENGRTTGAEAIDLITRQKITIRAKSVINAAGPFVKSQEESARHEEVSRTALSRDMAFVVKRKISEKAAIGVQTKYKDPDAILSRGNRHLFLAPWRGYTLVGVNSKVYQGDPFDLSVSDQEINTFVDEIREAAPALNIVRSEIDVVYGGLLPFGDNDKEATDLSFGKRSLLVDHGTPSGGIAGLFSAMAVRWTMGRLTAEHAVNAAQTYLLGHKSSSRTHNTAVHGGDFELIEDVLREARADPIARSLDEQTRQRLVQNYGTEWKAPLEIARKDESLLKKVPHHDVIGAEIAYALESEMAITLQDCILRRTDLGTGEKPSYEALEFCASIASKIVGWDAARRESEIDNVERCFPFFGIPVTDSRPLGKK